MPFALETYGALSDRSDRFLVECATLASRESAGSGPSISLLCTRFRQSRVSIALQRSLAHAIHARTLRLEQSMALLPSPLPRNPLSFAEMHIVASFVYCDWLTYLSFLGYVVSLQTLSCNNTQSFCEAVSDYAPRLVIPERHVRSCIQNGVQCSVVRDSLSRGVKLCAFPSPWESQMGGIWDLVLEP